MAQVMPTPSHKQEQLALILARKLLEELAAAKNPAIIPIVIIVKAQAALRHFPTNTKIDLLYRNLKP